MVDGEQSMSECKNCPIDSARGAGTWERKISTSSNAILRFAVRKTIDDEGTAVHDTIDFTGSDLKLLQTPAPVAMMPSGVEGGRAIVDTVQSAIGGWQPLLDKLQIFCEVMDGVSEVVQPCRARFSGD